MRPFASKFSNHSSQVIGRKRELVLVTAYDADTGEPPAPHTDVLVRAARDHPEQIKLLDWVRYSLPHHKVDPAPGAWFLPDLFHPNFAGAHAYGNFLARVLPGGAPAATEKSSGGDVSWGPFALLAMAALTLTTLLLYRRRARKDAAR